MYPSYLRIRWLDFSPLPKASSVLQSPKPRIKLIACAGKFREGIGLFLTIQITHCPAVAQRGWAWRYKLLTCFVFISVLGLILTRLYGVPASFHPPSLPSFSPKTILKLWSPSNFFAFIFKIYGTLWKEHLPLTKIYQRTGLSIWKHRFYNSYCCYQTEVKTVGLKISPIYTYRCVYRARMCAMYRQDCKIVAFY